MDPLYDEPTPPRTLDELVEWKNALRRQALAQLKAAGDDPEARRAVVLAHDPFASFGPEDFVIRFDLIGNRA
jgi:hypothetical protein